MANVEVIGYPIVDFESENPVGVRKFIVDWSEIDLFRAEVLGGPTTLPSRFPGLPGLYAVKIKVEPLKLKESLTGSATNALAQLSQYHKTYATVTYKPLTIGQGPNSSLLWQEKIQFASQFVTNPHGSFEWETDGKRVEAQPGTRLPTGTYTIMSNWAPTPNHGIYKARVGTINSGTFAPLFLIGGISYDSGTLYYEGAQYERNITPDGVDAYKITHSWTWRKEHWNKLFRPSTGAWEFVQNEAGDRIYETENHYDILQ